MLIPDYAAGTLADLLEERINAIEEFILAVFSKEEYEEDRAIIEDTRDFYIAAVDQLNSAAKEADAFDD